MRCVFSAHRSFWWFQMASRFRDLYVGTRRSPRYIPWYVTLLTHLPYMTGYTLCTLTSKIIPYLIFRMVFLFYGINKMGTNGGGRVVDGVSLRRFQAILSRVEIPTWFLFFFANFCTNSYIRIHIICTFFIQIIQIHTYTNCIVQIHTIRTFFIQIVSAPTRPHPAAPSLGYTRLPRR
jgi:hypothetical protein